MTITAEEIRNAIRAGITSAVVAERNKNGNGHAKPDGLLVKRVADLEDLRLEDAAKIEALERQVDGFVGDLERILAQVVKVNSREKDDAVAWTAVGNRLTALERQTDDLASDLRGMRGGFATTAPIQESLDLKEPEPEKEPEKKVKVSLGPGRRKNYEKKIENAPTIFYAMTYKLALAGDMTIAQLGPFMGLSRSTIGNWLVFRDPIGRHSATNFIDAAKRLAMVWTRSEIVQAIDLHNARTEKMKKGAA